jgi:hypothetical protein
MAKMNMVREYLDEEVNFGGVRMPRGQMIRELTAIAKATHREDWQALVNIYLTGHARKNGQQKTIVSEECKCYI